MPARLRQAKSDTYVPEPVGFAIPEAKMRVLRTVILAVRFLFAVRRERSAAHKGHVPCVLCCKQSTSACVSRAAQAVLSSIGRGKDLPILPRHTSKIQVVRPF